MSVNSVVVVNVGSSSAKLATFQDDAVVERAKVSPNVVTINDWLRPRIGAAHAIGHRLVHSGPKFTRPIRITPTVLQELDAIAPFAPLHMPPALAVIRSCAEEWPTIPQVATFDTSFHATMPSVEQRFGIPRQFHDQGIRRYGFHGLSYESIASQLPNVSARAACGKTIVAHLGSGCSVCGMNAGRSLTTSMGFSPLDGVLMATRPGRLDVGVVLYWLQQGRSLHEISHILEHESGWLGVSGVSSDMRVLLAQKTAEAHDAIELFSHSVAKEIAAAAVVLGGLDAIVFTGGIGEHSPTLRDAITAKLAWVGTFEVHVLATDEERVIAHHTLAEVAG